MPARVNEPFDAAAARRRCVELRRRILEISQRVKALHIAPAFSCIEIVDTIYHGLMRWDEKGRSPDTFVMSKGHGCMAQYVTLEKIGILPREDLERYCTAQGRLGCHPNYGVPGIEASTGSLGHGLSMCVGMAYAEKLRGDGRVFAVLSEGELQEGSTWEAILMASTLATDGLIIYIDNNDLQSLGRTSESHPHLYPLAEKFSSFGWEVAEVSGHDATALRRAAAERAGGRPLVVVARTVKGRGVSYMENVPVWHFRAPTRDEYRLALDELSEVRD